MIRSLCLVLLTSLLFAVPGSLTPASARCQDPYVSYRTWLVKGLHRRFPDLPVFKDGPGGTMTARVSRTDTRSATFGAATSAEAGAIFAKAKVEVSASVTKTASATIGHDYSRHIKPGHYGHLAYGTWAKKIGWRKIWHRADCTRTVLKRGRAVLPTKSLGWKFWQTRH